MFFGLREQLAAKQFGVSVLGTRRYQVGVSQHIREANMIEVSNLTKKYGGAGIYLKREDLNHTGAHKLNHCMGEALLAK